MDTDGDGGTEVKGEISKIEKNLNLFNSNIHGGESECIAGE